MPPNQFTLHPADDVGILLDEARQALFRLDARSSYVWCCLEEGLGPDEIVQAFTEDLGMEPAEARAQVEGILDRLARLGVLAERAEPAAPGRPRQAEPPTVSVRPGAGATACAFACRIALLGSVFDVAFPTADLLAAFRSIMGHLEAGAGAGAGGADCRVEVVERRTGFAVIVDGAEAELCSSTAEVGPQTKSAISVAAINRLGFGACLHSAVALADTGKALLLPGRSGTGKSCLALALARAGLTLLTDETALLDPQDFRVRGMPIACCVKSGGWEWIEPLYPALATRPEHLRVDGKRVRYLPEASVDAAAHAWPVGQIVFPHFAQDAQTRLEPLGLADSLGRLLESCTAWRIHLTPAFVDALIAWIETVDCYAIRYGSSVEAASILADLLASDAATTATPSSR